MSYLISENVVNDQKDEGKIEKLSPADEKRSGLYMFINIINEHFV